MEKIYYKCFYQPSGTVEKNFEFDAKSDSEALKLIKERMKEFNVECFEVEKIIENRIFESRG